MNRVLEGFLNQSTSTHTGNLTTIKPGLLIVWTHPLVKRTEVLFVCLHAQLVWLGSFFYQSNFSDDGHLMETAAV